MLAPDVSVSFANSGLTSALGRSLTFDLRADGYARAESSGVVIMDRAREHRASVELMRGSVVRQEGRTATLTAPSSQAQRAMIVAALADALLGSAQVDCVEAAANGSYMGDTMEAGAVSRALLGGPRYRVLALQGVKANMGHPELSLIHI